MEAQHSVRTETIPAHRAASFLSQSPSVQRMEPRSRQPSPHEASAALLCLCCSVCAAHLLITKSDGTCNMRMLERSYNCESSGTFQVLICFSVRLSHWRTAGTCRHRRL